jgi:hypothetical protein
MSKKPIFAIFLGDNIFKIITLVPGSLIAGNRAQTTQVLRNVLTHFADSRSGS